MTWCEQVSQPDRPRGPGGGGMLILYFGILQGEFVVDAMFCGLAGTPAVPRCGLAAECVCTLVSSAGILS